MHRSLTTLLLTSALAAPALADGLDKARVPARARAVLHVDVEALLASQLVRELEKVDPDVKLDFDLGEHEPLLEGVRPLQDVRSVTIFTADAASERFGAVVRTSDKADALLQVAIASDAYELVPLGDWQVHSWKQGAKRAYGAVVPLPLSSDRLVLVTNDAQLMRMGSPSSRAPARAWRPRPRASSRPSRPAARSSSSPPTSPSRSWATSTPPRRWRAWSRGSSCRWARRRATSSPTSRWSRHNPRTPSACNRSCRA